MEIERKKTAGSSAGPLGTHVTQENRADNMIRMLRATRTFMLQNTNEMGELTDRKPIFAKSLMEQAEESKTRQLIGIAALRQPTPSKGSGLTKLNTGALATANTTAGKFEEAVRTINN